MAFPKKIKDEALANSGRRCCLCNKFKGIKVEVHHIVPFHVDPSKELQPTNFITLCQSKSHNDHLIFGHLLDFHAQNAKVLTDAKNYRGELAKRKIVKGASE